MGGDLGPKVALEGALQALPELEGTLTIIGDEKTLKPLLNKRRFRPLSQSPKCKLETVFSTEAIEMEDSIKAVRGKPNAPINMGNKMAAESWKRWKKEGV